MCAHVVSSDLSSTLQKSITEQARVKNSSFHHDWRGGARSSFVSVLRVWTKPGIQDRKTGRVVYPEISWFFFGSVSEVVANYRDALAEITFRHPPGVFGSQSRHARATARDPRTSPTALHAKHRHQSPYILARISCLGAASDRRLEKSGRVCR